MGRVSFERRDFFDFEVSEDSRFDLVYDYTYVQFILMSVKKASWKQILCRDSTSSAPELGSTNVQTYQARGLPHYACLSH
jgi:hypothetical protein